jgi:hypothetical protein
MIHLIIVKVSGELSIFNQLWELKGLLLGEIGVGWLVRAWSRCSSLQRGKNLREASNPCNATVGILFRLRPTQK